jgi:gamma-glutamyltranspeptidase/glutathione hydrolase
VEQVIAGDWAAGRRRACAGAAGITAAGGVVAAAHPLAAEAGAATLARGGNAVDAAVATAAMLSVVEPFGSGLGGGGFLVYYEAASATAVALDGRETAPATASVDMFLAPDGEPWPRALLATGGLAVGAPGQARCWAEALRRWGRLGLGDVLAPAIRVAHDGFAVTPYFVREVRANRPRLAACAASGRAFLPDGRPPPVGWRLRQPDLAATLELLAIEGPDGFYARLAPEIAATVAASAPGWPAGRLRAEDVAAYGVRLREPARGTYRGHGIAASAAPSSGLTVIQALHLLERFDLRDLEPHAPTSVHLLGEALRVAHADRIRWLGDPDHAPVPSAALASRSYAAARNRITLDRTSAARTPAGCPATCAAGYAGARLGQPAGLVGDEMEADAASTTHLSVADAAGNAVAYTATLGTHFGAALMVPGRGFLLNNALRNFRFDPRGAISHNLAAPGKRPRSSIAPALVFDPAGRLRWVLGAAGAAWITPLVVQLIVSLVDWDLPPQAAVDAPRAMADDTAGTLLLEPALHDTRPRLVAALGALGHGVLRAGGPRGAAQIVALDPDGGAAQGAADRRRDGAVAVSSCRGSGRGSR